jgi:hypothetical protein
MKLTTSPAFILTSLGITWCWLRAPGKLLGNLSNGGSVCHAPKLTVALVGRRSSAIAKRAANPRNSRTTRQIVDRVECLIWFPPQVTLGLITVADHVEHGFLGVGHQLEGERLLRIVAGFLPSSIDVLRREVGGDSRCIDAERHRGSIDLVRSWSRSHCPLPVPDGAGPSKLAPLYPKPRLSTTVTRAEFHRGDGRHRAFGRSSFTRAAASRASRRGRVP